MAYLDHAATTPMLDEALDAYVSAAREVGNPSSLHAAGRCARRTVEESRERIAAALGARPSEVIFTGGGTESDNLAVKGMFWARRDAADGPRRDRVVASAVEHHAVLDAVEWLERHEGAAVTWLPVDAGGRLDPAIAGRGAAHATTSPWSPPCGPTTRSAPSSRSPTWPRLAAARGVPFHTDAVQAVGQVPVDFAASGAAALTLTGHKLGGPIGVGALLLGRDVACTPLLHGGGQERDVRSGTLDAPGIVAFAVAVEAAVKGQQEYAARVGALRDDLIARVRAGGARTRSTTATRTTGCPATRTSRSPAARATPCCCSSTRRGSPARPARPARPGVAQPSHVLLAMGADDDRARSSLRFTLGHTSTQADVDALVAALPAAVERARRAGMVKSR